MVKVMKTEAVVSSGLVNSLMWARAERRAMQIETVRPIGKEYSMILAVKRFLMRSVFFSRDKTRPGKPIQAKLSKVISMGLKG